MNTISNINTISKRFEIKEDGISIVVDSHGAKLLAILKNGYNILHYDKNDIAHSGIPICLPNFGPLTNGELIIDEKKYELRQHGFIRDLDFSVKTNENSIICSTTHSVETLTKYPFKFNFSVEFTLSKNSVSILLTLKNKDSKPMPIAPGIHPYFAVSKPKTIIFTTNAKNGDNNLKNMILESIEESGVFNKKENGYYGIKKAPDFNLINHTLNETIIKSDDMTKTSIKYDYSIFNRLTIWRKEENSNYICVEPAFVQNGINDCPIIIEPGCEFKTEVIITML